ncbi:AAA family ATPase [Fervidobacterium pennivorans subsp. shakshaketiis]|uniref:ATP-binding protein n=1 Tax=Fervidobacterium pennivorans TaxID=93466 RepID=UPI00355C3068
MRIKKFHISEYGPITFSKPFQLRNFTIFYGKNESGKTLTIEAILKMLVGKKEAKEKYYENIDRVKEFPTGYLILEDGGKSIYVENGEFLKQFNLSHEELKNTIIIRNSDLGIESSQKNKESDVYSIVTEKLVGSRISEIQSIRAKILENSIITESGIFKDQKDAKYKQRYEKARAVIQEINALLPSLESADYFEIEEKITKIQSEIELLKKKLNTLEIVKQENLCNELLEDIHKLESVVEKLKEYEPYTSEKLQKLIELENEIKNHEARVEELTKRAEQTKESLTKITSELSDIQKNIPRIREQSEIAAKIKEKILIYESQDSRFEQLKRNKTLWLILTIFMLIAGTFSLVFAPGAVLKSALSSLFYGISIFMLLKTFEAVKLINNVEQTLREILKDATELFRMPFNDVTEVKARCLEAESQYKEILQRESQLRTSQIEIENSKSSLHTELESQQNALSKAQREREELLNLLSVKSPDELRQKLDEKSKLEGQYQALKSQILTKLKTFAVKFNELPNDLPELFDTDAIRNLENLKDIIHNYLKELSISKSKETKETREPVELVESEEAIKSKIDQLQKELEILKNNQRQQQENMKFILIKVQESKLIDSLFDEIPDVVYKSHLEKLKSQLEKLITCMDKRKKIELTALKILQETEEEEKKNISDIFKQSNLIKLFTEITDGRYVDVAYESNQGSGKIKVKDISGIEFTPEQLSAGTYDQLYFSIRLALAEHLFGKNSGEKAFFILDDPFVKYDRNRLEKQIKKLVDLSNQGWQFLYFTAKDEVIEIGEKIGIDIIKLEEFI